MPTDGQRPYFEVVIRDQLTDALAAALDAAGIEVDRSRITLERPARREHGDWSANAAMVAAKAAGRPPRELAAELAAWLEEPANRPAHVERIEVAGPGFVNVHLAPSWLHDVLTEVVGCIPAELGASDDGAGRAVNIEFVSANPTGPLHAGHGRGATYGDALARLLERTGWQVTREFYVNDRGTQMRHYAASLAAAAAGQPVPEDGYRGEYITRWATELPSELADGPPPAADGDDVDPLLEWGLTRALDDHRDVLDLLGVHFDVWFSERSMVGSGAIDATLADLRQRGVAYDSDGAVWLRSSDFGDDKDRVLVRSGGEPTYLLPDIAYHRDKYGRGFALLVDVWGADHHGYVPRMAAALAALGHEPDSFEAVITQLVNLQRDGEPVRLSKRAGEIVELRDVVDEVGTDAARFTFLLQSVNTAQTFDLELAKRKSMDNPVYYVQYAHARIASIVRKAEGAGIERLPLEQVDLAQLTHERELALLRALEQFPEVVADAARTRGPHKITAWLRELAGRFHGFYHDCYVVADSVDPELTQARLWLVEATRVGLVSGLDLVGVSAPDAMDVLDDDQRAVD
ncbi:MAG: arginine--tRNA ligase [Acidimicrobiia bacterium]|nr:arginine--tRNA ligase [Acidimicrobiia bacterium]